VLLSYTLHRPGQTGELRVEHWPAIECPVLLLSGDRDQFARLDLLESSIRRLQNAQLHVYRGMGHGLVRCAPDVAERIEEFVVGLPPERPSPPTPRGLRSTARDRPSKARGAGA
jgi:pimeloyl-ACP methyl ester carboxylesterase